MTLFLSIFGETKLKTRGSSTRNWRYMYVCRRRKLNTVHHGHSTIKRSIVLYTPITVIYNSFEKHGEPTMGVPNKFQEIKKYMKRKQYQENIFDMSLASASITS